MVNDYDVDGDELEVVAMTETTIGGGRATYLAEGIFAYIPAPDFNGTDSFTYTISDGNGGIDTALVEVEVIPVADIPIANPDFALTDEDTQVSVGDPLANDVDADGDILTLADFDATSAQGGLVTQSGSALLYNPPAEFSGTDTFTYVADDGDHQVTGTVTVTVKAVNDAPVAGDDSISTYEDTLLITSNLMLNDSDVDGPNLSIIDYDRYTPNGGVVILTTNGSFHYVPGENYYGGDSFTYLLSDGAGLTDMATVTIDVISVNDVPTADPLYVTLPEDSVDYLIDDVLDHVTDLDGGTLELVDKVGTTAFGGAYSIASPDLFYTSLGDYNGEDMFAVTVIDGQGGSVEVEVHLTVTSANDSPVATDDLAIAVTMEEQPTVTGNVLANDTDIDGDTLTVSSCSGVSAAGGFVEGLGDGTFTYTPPVDFFGPDSFAYTVSDGNGGFDDAVAHVTVNPVNDAPVVGDLSRRTPEDIAITLTEGELFPRAGDVDDDYATLTLAADVVTATGGSVVESPAGTYIYTPAENFHGTDYFTTTVTDPHGAAAYGLVTMTVLPVNDAPVAAPDASATYEDMAVVTSSVLMNDSDADGDTLTIGGYDNFTLGGGKVAHSGGGSFLYTPAANWNGIDTFSYIITDGNGGTSSAIVTVEVLPVADTAIANPDFGSVAEDGVGVTIDVLANDLDGDGDVLTIYYFDAAPAGGTVSQSGNSLSFVPDADFSGVVTFTYTVSEDGGTTGSSSGTVTVTVTPANDAPVGIADVFATDEETAVVFSVLTNDYDVDGDTLTVVGFPTSTLGGGVLTYHGAGVFTYTPGDDFFGADLFRYTLVDETGALSSSVEVTIDVAPVDDDPVAVDDAALASEDTSVLIAALSNDYDPDIDPVSLLTHDPISAGGGTVTELGGVFLYTPAGNFFGIDTFTYTIEDAGGNTDSATVTITVNEVNDPPVANPDSTSGPEDNPLLVPYVLINDTDADGDLVSVLTSDPYSAVGAMVINNGDGTFTYAPLADFNGVDTFTYTITDGRLGFATTTVTVTVTPVNDAPSANPDMVSTNEDTPAAGLNLAANDSDPEGDIFGVVDVDFISEAGAVLTLDGATGLVTYTPPLNFYGTDTFGYTLQDAGGAQAIGEVTVYVSPVNDVPVALDVNLSIEQGDSITFEVYATDGDGDVLLFNSPLASLEGGSILNHGEGTFTYQPDVDFVGPDYFTVTVEDGRGGVATPLVSISVNAAADVDSDGDGLTDFMEVNHYSTSPSHMDTDGDGLSDGREIIELGFNPLQDNYRFNPLIADLPEIGIEFGCSPQILLVYTTGTTESTSTTIEDSSSDTHSETTEVGVEVEVEFEGYIPSGGSVTGSVSHSWTDEQTNEHREAYENARANQEDYSGGLIQVTLNVENRGDIAFTIDNLILSAFVPSQNSPGEFLPVANLELDVSVGDFPQTTLGPGQRIEGWVFAAELDLGTTLDLLSDSRSLIVQPSSYELTDALGRAFNHNLTDVMAKTALVSIDYGFDRPMESYRVATNLDYYVDPSLYGVTVGEVFDTAGHFLKIPFTATATPFTVTDGVPAPDYPVELVDGRASNPVPTDGAWRFSTSADFEGLTVDQIKLRAGDVLTLVYCADTDLDGLGEREEYLWGTDPFNPDTDADGLSDFDEVRGWDRYDYPAGTPQELKFIYFSNPLVADSEGDGLFDYFEYANVRSDTLEREAADPYHFDTDLDFLQDDVDPDPTIPDADYLITGLAATTSVDNTTGSQIYDVDLTWSIVDPANVTNIVLLRYQQSAGEVPPAPMPPTDVSDFPSWTGPGSGWTRVAQTVAPTATTFTDNPAMSDIDYVYYAYVQVDFYGDEKLVFCEFVKVPFRFAQVRITVDRVYLSTANDDAWGDDNSIEFFGWCDVQADLAVGYVNTWDDVNVENGNSWYPSPSWTRDFWVGQTVSSNLELELSISDRDSEPTNDDDIALLTISETWNSVVGWDLGQQSHDFTIWQGNNSKYSYLTLYYTIDDLSTP
ncbi:MAG: hypothetical protein C0608_11385 [Deltaproteobacteria bacterium]|nr:MAG: hypothetical protein C0608_11385 [Deltaproteobacteria bacterium]